MTEQEIKRRIKNVEYINWYYIIKTQKLNEDFIREIKNEVDWYFVSKYQKLSEIFIREFQDQVTWDNISKYQKLSEEFIREFQDQLDWLNLSIYQKLSENFIREFQNKVNWYNISIYQNITKEFIKEFQNKIDLINVSRYQKLSDEFFKEFNLEKPVNNWLYTDLETKKKAVLDCGLYEVEGDYVIAYKGIRSDNYSAYNFQYQYFVGNTYYSNANHNLDNQNSFGLSAWTLEQAKKYCNEKIIKVKIPINAIAALVHDNYKIRTTEFEVIEEIPNE
jgi:hypothetical protein